jgi:hypothetical protein
MTLSGLVSKTRLSTGSATQGACAIKERVLRSTEGNKFNIIITLIRVVFHARLIASRTP